MPKKSKPLGKKFTLTLPEVATLLGISPETVQEWTDDRKIDLKITKEGEQLYRERDAYVLLRREQGREHNFTVSHRVTLNPDGTTSKSYGYVQHVNDYRALDDELLRTNQPVRHVSTESPRLTGTENFYPYPGTSPEHGVSVQAWATAWTQPEAEQIAGELAEWAKNWLLENMEPIIGVIGWKDKKGNEVR